MLIVLLFFLFIFNVPLKGLPLGTASIVTVSLLVWGLAMQRRARISVSGVFSILLFFTFVSGYYTFMTVLNGKYDLSFLQLAIKNLVIVPIGAFLLINLLSSQEHDGGSKLMIKNVNRAFLVQSGIILASLLFPSMRDIIHGLMVHEYFADVSARYGGFRALGFAYSVTFDLSVVFSIALFLTVYLWRVGNIGTFVLLVSSFSFVVAIGVSGRTGIATTIILFAMAAFLGSRRLLVGRLDRKTLQIIAMGFIVLILAAWVGYVYFPRVVDFILLPFQLLMEGQINTSGSIATTFSDINWPKNASLFVFGAGQYLGDADGWRYYGNTDIGYLRWLHVLGIIGSTAIYLGVILLSTQIIVRFKKAGLDSLGRLWLLILFAGLIVDIKGQFVFNHYFMSFLFLFYFCSLRVLKNRGVDD